MQRPTLGICSRCRFSLFGVLGPSKWLTEVQHNPRRFRTEHSQQSSRKRVIDKAPAFAPRRTDKPPGPLKRTIPKSFGLPSVWSSLRARPPPRRSPSRVSTSYDNTPIASDTAGEYFKKQVGAWCTMPRVRVRMTNFGVPPRDISPLLKTFKAAAERGDLTDTPELMRKYRIEQFSQPFDGIDKITHVDRVFTSILYFWATDRANELHLSSIVPLSTLASMRALLSTLDMGHPAEDFPYARSMHRKIIMHVGPTNSGKTHNALRALAAARVGVYAGPLRLLAHEIWERLNKGQIVPLGVDLAAETLAEADDRTAFDVPEGSKEKVAVRKGGNPKYARLCNLLTGEDQKIVHDSAPLTSATVEMLSTIVVYDVAVVDEIQMIGDPERGGAWTNAVLGLRAKELHLCGEETAVPIIEALARETGDEVIVNRYQRLTPLQVEDRSLKGYLGNIRRGDCLVTFSRNGIFALKKRVEEQTHYKCAVVYGALPPEVRSEQAALFNDPESGYAVLIGSDAIGMGLNLKIKRIVFETVKKWDGREERQLSDSQIKQIAGRAGRYGLHSDNPCGLVTTMNSYDLPKVVDALAAPPKPLLHARIQCPRQVLEEAYSALPRGSRTSVLQDAVMYLGQLKPTFRLAELLRMRDITDFLDAKGGALSFTDYRQFMQAPIPWRDVACVDVLEAFLKMYTGRLNVRLITAVRHARSDLTDALREVEKSIAMPGPASTSHVNLSETLSLMESFHRIVTLYLWMSYRNPVVWSDFDACIDLKWRLEKALEWCLRSISRDKAENGRPSRGRHSARGEPVNYMTAVEQRRILEEKKAEKVQQRVLLPLG